MKLSAPQKHPTVVHTTVKPKIIATGDYGQRLCPVGPLVKGQLRLTGVETASQQGDEISFRLLLYVSCYCIVSSL